MKRCITAAVIAAASSFALAHAQGYVQGSAGAAATPWLDISGVGYRLNTGFNIGVSGGLRLPDLIGPSWDLRGDILYTQNEYDCCIAHLGGTSFMASLIYHFDLGLSVRPYIGAGVGGVAVHYGNALTGPHNTKIGFGGQALAGAEYPLFGPFSMFGEYRYIAASKVTIGGVGTVDYQTHNFMVGIKLAL